MHAWLNLRYTAGSRATAFRAGLQALGYEVRDGVTLSPMAGDVLVTWNRIGDGDRAARAFESAGLPVLVAENAAWGNDFAGHRWLTIARNRHNTAGMFPAGGPDRWDSLGVELAPWRTSGELVILAQRGIGSEPTAMPKDWPQVAQARYGGRIRRHPGKCLAKPLAEDLARCGRIVTWGSGAAVQALIWGIPVTSDMPGWIAQQDNTDASRLSMLRRLAWAQWRIGEIQSGEAFRCLLS